MFETFKDKFSAWGENGPGRAKLFDDIVKVSFIVNYRRYKHVASFWITFFQVDENSYSNLTNVSIWNNVIQFF